MNRMKPPALSMGRRTGLLLGILVLLIVIGGLFHRQIRNSLEVHLLLKSEAPEEELFNNITKTSNDPVPFLNRCFFARTVSEI
jgi:hypothetical protein